MEEKEKKAPLAGELCLPSDAILLGTGAGRARVSATETITDMKRYYEATLPSGAKFYISNQWGTQTDAFMEYVNNCVDGITVTKL